MINCLIVKDDVLNAFSLKNLSHHAPTGPTCRGVSSSILVQKFIMFNMKIECSSLVHFE